MMIEKHCINARYGKHKWVEPVGKNKRHADAGIRVCKYCSRVERVATTEQEDSFDLGCSERLRSWAQNEEMIDQYFTDHGKDCNEAVKEIERLQARVEKLEAALEKIISDELYNEAQMAVIAQAALKEECRG